MTFRREDVLAEDLTDSERWGISSGSSRDVPRRQQESRVQTLRPVSRTPRTKRFLSCFFASSTVRRAIRVALVVGPILGMINHFDLLLGEPVSALRVVKICVTFAVPYCVSAYSSATTMMAQGG